MCEVGSCNRGITCLELYILYRITWNSKPVDEMLLSHGDKSRPVISLDLQLGHFKRHVRSIVERTLLGGTGANLFKPMQVIEDNLRGVGVEGKHPAVRFNVFPHSTTSEQGSHSFRAEPVSG